MFGVWNVLRGRGGDEGEGEGANGEGESCVSEGDKDREQCDKLVSNLTFALASDAKEISEVYMRWCDRVSQEYVGASCCYGCPVIGSNYVIDVPSMAKASAAAIGEESKTRNSGKVVEEERPFPDDFRAIALTWLGLNDRVVEIQLCEGKTGLVVFRTGARKSKINKSTVKAVLTLIETSCSLESQERDIEKNLMRTAAEARAAQRAGNQALSRRLLHKVGALKTVLEKRTRTAENVNALLLSISNAATDAQVLDVCRDGARVLRNMTIGESGERLTPEAAEAIMDDVLETIYDQRDIDDEISRQCSRGDSAESDAEIEAELNEMEREVKERRGEGARTGPSAALQPSKANAGTKVSTENEEEKGKKEEDEEDIDKELEELGREMNKLTLSKAN